MALGDVALIFLNAMLLSKSVLKIKCNKSPQEDLLHFFCYERLRLGMAVIP
jgi:hypothetical protein